MIYNEIFFARAYELAKIAFDNNMVPIGAVLVQNNNVIAEAYNGIGIKHAELICLLNNQLTTYDKTSLYVTLEPCNMCMNAIKLSRINYLFFGAYRKNKISHDLLSIGGIEEKQCATLLKKFFHNKRYHRSKKDRYTV